MRTTRRAFQATLGRTGMVLVMGLCLGGSAVFAAEPAEKSGVTAERSEAPSKVKREGTKVWIEGVPTLAWGTNHETTYAGALEAAMAVTEHPYTYAEIMGYSGLAFRVRWFRTKEGPGWCPSSPVGEFPEEIAATQKATGWRLRVEERMANEDAPHMENLAADIVASVDAGRPVVAYTMRLNMGVIYGYEDGGKAWLVRDYFKGAEPFAVPATDLGPMAIFLEGYSEPPARREALVEALRIAVRNWRREPLPSGEKGQYGYGDAALAQWAEDIGQAGDLADEKRQELFFVSCWNYSSLADARAAAIEFLNKNAGLLDGEARAALERAAGLYGKEAGLLGSAFADKNAFFGPWSGKTMADWTPEVRRREQEILTEARKIEAQAIAEIEKALAAVGD